MGQTKEAKLLKQIAGKQQIEKKTPIATDMFLPNHSGIKSHPEFKDALGDYVPYTGATGNVNLGANNITGLSLIGTNGLFAGDITEQYSALTGNALVMKGTEGSNYNINVLNDIDENLDLYIDGNGVGNGTIYIRNNTTFPVDIEQIGVHTATNFISNVAIGTSPYACTSTTLNTNLNADYVDTKHATDFTLAYVTGNGAITTTNVKINADNTKLYFGAGDDASIYYDGNNMHINPREVGTGNLRLTAGNFVLGSGNVYQRSDTYGYRVGAGDDASIIFDGNSLNIVANVVTAGDTLNLTAASIECGSTPITTSGAIRGVHKCADGTGSVADGTYVTGLKLTGGGTDGSITIKDGIITAITQAT